MTEEQKKDALKGVAWSLAGAKTLAAGVAFWGMVATKVVIAGPAALAVFGTLAGSSAIGIGTVVGYCAGEAQKNF